MPNTASAHRLRGVYVASTCIPDDIYTVALCLLSDVYAASVRLLIDVYEEASTLLLSDVYAASVPLLSDVYETSTRLLSDDNAASMRLRDIYASSTRRNRLRWLHARCKDITIRFCLARSTRSSTASWRAAACACWPSSSRAPAPGVCCSPPRRSTAGALETKRRQFIREFQWKPFFCCSVN